MAAFDPGFDPCAFVSKIIGEIVSEPDQLSIVPIVSPGGGYTTLQVIVSKDHDRGRLIGRAGRTAHSLRIILQAVMKKQNRNFRLEILKEAEARTGAFVSPESADSMFDC